MDQKLYVIGLGELLRTFQSLEFLLRSFLYEKADPPHTKFPDNFVIQKLSVGDTVETNAATDFSSLSQLIDRYNKLIKPTAPELMLDPSIVQLRDALAHGRVSTIHPT